jgi:hypothetical protein
MQRCPRNLLVLGWLAMLLLAASAPNLTAQATGKDQAKAGDELAAKQVSIETIDKVELKGKFYPAKGKDATCVMLLHALGESSDNKEWNNFAKKLQEKGYAVLTFDFRGHGESTAVQPGMPNPKNPKLSVRGFWDEDLNRQGVKGLALNKPRPTEIKYADFAPTYYPVLCNDIAAARQFLDEQPDVNSNNLILIGAKDGATVGALWLNSEFHRFRYLSQSGQVARLDRQNPEGLAVAGCVWLSLSSMPGTLKSSINVGPMLEVPAKIFKVPTLFVYGQGDDKGKTLAHACEKYVSNNDSKSYPFTGCKTIEKAEKAAGKELLLQDLDTTAVILEYLDKLPAGKMAKAGKRTGDESYRWEYTTQSGTTSQVSARDTGSKLLKFSGYSSWLR